MRHEKEFPLEDGGRVKVHVEVHTDDRAVYWGHGCEIKPKGGRKWRHTPSEVARPEEVLATKLELWEKLKPS